MVQNQVGQGTFEGLGIAPKLMEILQKNKFVNPTPIQAQSIPPAIQGKDLMGIAQTGTGKTLAFGVPMIQRIVQSKGTKKGLVILPTRELALQVEETLRKIGASIGLKTAILIGGESMHKQLRALRQNPHVTIATPGRLIDHIENNKLDLSVVGILVLDEADRMLDMGFEPQIKKILQRVPKSRQTMLFSATMPNEIVNIAQSYMHLPLRVEVAPAGSAVKAISQELFFIDRAQKLSLLKSLLEQYKGSVLVFSRTKHGARKITRAVKSMGHTAAEIHSNRSLNQRLEALDGFKDGNYRVLIATDIAARGIDVTGIEVVINFDLPATAEDYVHRIGRTGRAGLAGHAISFATADQRSDVRSIERLIKKTLPVSRAPAMEGFVEPKQTYRSEDSFRGGRQQRRTQGRGYSERRHSGPRSGAMRPSSNRPERGFRRGNSRGGYATSKTRRNDIPSLRRKPAAEGQGYFLSRYRDTADDM